MLADHVLQLLRAFDEPGALLAEVGRRQLRCVAGTLRLDSDRVELVIGRAPRQRLHGLPQPRELLSGDLGQRLRELAGGGLCGSCKRVEEPEVALAAHRFEQLVAVAGPLRDEPRPQASERTGVVLLQRRRLGVEVLEQHVEVADGAEQTAEPLQLRAQGLGPAARDQPAAGAQQRPGPPRRDAQLVQRLDVLSEPDSGIVREDRAVLLDEQRPKVADRVAVLRWCRRRAEDEVELRAPRRGHRACLAQCLADRGQSGSVAGDGGGFDLGPSRSGADEP